MNLEIHRNWQTEGRDKCKYKYMSFEDKLCPLCSIVFGGGAHCLDIHFYVILKTPLLRLT